MARVKWTEAEMDTLYTATADLMKNDSKLKLIKAVMQAQIVLPESRRRKFTVPMNIPEYLRNRFIVNGQLPKDWGVAKGKPDELDPRDEQIATLKSNLETITAENERLQAELNAYRYAPKPPTEIEVIRKFCAGILAEAGWLAARQGAVQPQPAAEKPKAEKPPVLEQPAEQPAKPRKPVVYVLGPKGHQQTELEHEFGELLELRIYDADKSNSLKSDVSHAKGIVAWTKFLDHSTTGRYSGYPNYRPAATLFALKEILAELALT